MNKHRRVGKCCVLACTVSQRIPNVTWRDGCNHQVQKMNTGLREAKAVPEVTELKSSAGWI
jgi:hypothetical protein